MAKIIIASGPVIVEGGKVLLDKSGDDNFWKFCGGKVEDSDINLVETAKRRVKEEMGIEAEIVGKIPFLMYVQKPGDESVDVLLVHYLAKRVGEIKPGADIREWIWLPLEGIEARQDLAPNILPALKHFGLI
jgi:8-oxo-dGTP pyrophosphatase MutT (NUDIX family)